MEHQLTRTEMLLGADGLERLKHCRVAVFGLGGVGGYAAEALARSGIGALDLIDPDKIALTNLNRQILALHSTVGQYKTAAAEARIHDIAPDCSVRTYNMFFLPETADSLDFSAYDYVIDAVDTVSGKLAIVKSAQEAGVPVISVMGTGNKLDPSKLQAADLYDTSVCPLARVMRRECRKRGISSLRVVYSTEEPVRPEKEPEAAEEKLPEGTAPEKRQKDVPGSSAFVPAAAGMIAAAEAVRVLCNRE